MKFTVIFNHIVDRIIEFAAVLAGVGVVFVMISICFDVISRRLLNMGQEWPIEYTEYALLYITFLSTAWVLKKEAHVKMDLLLNRLKPRNQALLNTATSIIGAMLCLIMAWFGVLVTWDMFQRGIHRPTPLYTPMAPLIAVIPVGSFLLLIQFLRRAYGYLRSGEVAKLNWEGEH